MRKSIVIGLMLTFLAVPFAARAQMPGQPCQMAQVGTTRMADNHQSIIACLETGEKENPAIWKSTIGGGGGDWQCFGAGISNTGVTICVRGRDGLICSFVNNMSNTAWSWDCRMGKKGWPGP